MFIYFILVFGIVIVTSALLIFIFGKIKILNYSMILAIALSSVLAALLFPGLFNLLSIGKGGVSDIPALLFIFGSTMILYIMLTFILSIIISIIIPDNVLNSMASGKKGGRLKDRSGESKHEDKDKAIEKMDAGENYLEQIYSGHIVENLSKDANAVDNTQKAENNLEKSVDSEKNIDKMGIEDEIYTQENRIDKLEENTLDSAENLSLNDCVDMAFTLKEQGDFESAILYYMYALDRMPDKDLVFWIVLDICVLYKSLGQAELAHDILSNYVSSYSDMMESTVLEEIEKNLLYIRE